MLKQHLILELDRPLPERKNNKVIGLMKDELDWKTMTEFPALIHQTYSYLTDSNDGNKKVRHNTKT